VGRGRRKKPGPEEDAPNRARDDLYFDFKSKKRKRVEESRYKNHAGKGGKAERVDGTQPRSELVVTDRGNSFTPSTWVERGESLDEEGKKKPSRWASRKELGMCL